ncbi:MAG TPA: sulfotransferase [Planctomycetes bacterium]|nr:sulfotransferase [Planctomycetota bacterium]
MPVADRPPSAPAWRAGGRPAPHGPARFELSQRGHRMAQPRHESGQGKRSLRSAGRGHGRRCTGWMTQIAASETGMNGQGRDNKAKVVVAETGGARDRIWYARGWDGMPLAASLQLLAKNRFAIAPSRLGMALVVLALGPFNSLLATVQRIVYGRRIERTAIRQGPVFILGHWRSGTTLLHELLALDPEHTYPTTYDCFAPSHFLVSASFLPALVKHVTPRRRPMDSMAFGLQRPQEDEFALCNLGVPSPYWMIAFPNRRPQQLEYLTLEGLSLEARRRWQQTFIWFLRCLTCREPKRLVLKSPPHTARLRVLLSLLPDARFIHIVRDPYVLFPSTLTLWKRLFRQQGFQVPREEGLEELVFETLVRMYEAFERDRPLVPPGHLCEVRYERLVAEPAAQLERIYRELDLGPFDRVRPGAERYLAERADYRPNRYEISDHTRQLIRRRWAAYIERYGYGTTVGA